MGLGDFSFKEWKAGSQHKNIYILNPEYLTFPQLKCRRFQRQDPHFPCAWGGANCPLSFEQRRVIKRFEFFGLICSSLFPTQVFFFFVHALTTRAMLKVLCKVCTWCGASWRSIPVFKINTRYCLRPQSPEEKWSKRDPPIEMAGVPLGTNW